MNQDRFGPRCPVCAGPAVLAAGQARCVACGYGVLLTPPPRRAVRRSRQARICPPRQLMLAMDAA